MIALCWFAYVYVLDRNTSILRAKFNGANHG